MIEIIPFKHPNAEGMAFCGESLAGELACAACLDIEKQNTNDIPLITVPDGADGVRGIVFLPQTKSKAQDRLAIVTKLLDEQCIPFRVLETVVHDDLSKIQELTQLAA